MPPFQGPGQDTRKPETGSADQEKANAFFVWKVGLAQATVYDNCDCIDFAHLLGTSGLKHHFPFQARVLFRA